MSKTNTSQFTAVRDIVIAVQVNLQNLKDTMTTGMADIRNDMVEIKTGVNTTLTDHERRLRLMEDNAAKWDLAARLTIYDQDHDWIAQHQARMKLIMTAMAAIGGAIGTLATLIGSGLHVLK